MKSQILYLVGGALIGGVIGFMGANYLNRASSNQAGSRALSAANSGAPQGQDTLSPEEIKAQLQKADSNPQDIVFQKSLGIALYGYGAAKEDPALIVEAIRLLERAEKADSKDRDVIIALGNAHFDIGYFKKENERFERARAYYDRVLEISPRDANIIVDVGLTYALMSPPDLPKAVEWYKKGLVEDPRHERTLQMFTDALIQMGKNEEASAQLARLKEVNPANPMINEFSTKIGAIEASR